MKGSEEQLLRDAVARNSGAVLSLPSAGMLRHCKSRFLGEHDSGLLLELPGDQVPLINSLIGSEQDVVVAFKSGIYKIAFASRLIASMPQHPISAGVCMDVVVVSRPTNIQTLQRRAHYRARIPAHYAVRVRVWRIPEHAYIKAPVLSAQEVQCEIKDISVGGMGVRFSSKDGQAPKISSADRLRVQVTFGEEVLILEGRMRDPCGAASADAIVAGVSFKKLENNIEGRQIIALLTRIVGDLQREELRVLRTAQTPAA